MSVMETMQDLMSAKPENAVEMSQDDINRYRNMITNAERFAKDKFIKAYATRYLNYLKGDLNDRQFAVPGSQEYDPAKMYKIFCNEFWVNSETLKPNLYFQNPHVSLDSKQEFVEKVTEVPMVDLTGQPMIDPMTNEIAMEPNVEQLPGEEVSELLENVVNDILTSRAINWKRIAKKCVAAVIPLNIAVSKWGWNTELAGENMDLQLEKDEPVCEWFNPMNFLPDPECTTITLKDAKYVIFRYIKPTETIKASHLYKGVENLKGTSELRFVGGKEDSTNLTQEYVGAKLDLERNTLYEIWDLTRRRVVTFVDGLEYPIRDDEWLWGLKGYPCKILSFGESLDGFYPTPEFKAYESLVMTKTLLIQKITNLLLTLNQIYLYDKTAIKDKNELQSVIDGKQGGLCGVTNPEKRDITSFIKELNDFHYSDSYNQFIKVIDDNLERLSGISDFRRGLITEAKRTATEILELQSGQNLRVEFKKDAVIEWMEENVQLLIELLQNNADMPKVQKIMKDNQAIWPVWSKEAIQGEYAVEISVGDMAKQNIQVKRKDDMDKYTVFNQNPLVNQVENTTDALRALGEKNPEKKLNQAAVQMYNATAGMSMANEAGLPMPQQLTDEQAVTGQVQTPNPALEQAKGAGMGAA